MTWCKLGVHNYTCYHAGIYKSFLKCTRCGKEKTVNGSSENNPNGKDK